MNTDELRAKILKDVLDLEYDAETESWGYTDGQGENEWFVTLHPAIIENMVIGVNDYTTNKIIEARIDELNGVVMNKSNGHGEFLSASQYEAARRKRIRELKALNHRKKGLYDFTRSVTGTDYTQTS